MVSWAGKALCVAAAGSSLLATGAFARVYHPTASELGDAMFAPGAEPAGMLSHRAAVLALMSDGSARLAWLPSHLLTARFGYLTDLDLARPVPGGAQSMRDVPAWEITLGGLALNSIGYGPPLPRPVLWRDVTFFVDAQYGDVLWQTFNHCAPCVLPHR